MEAIYSAVLIAPDALTARCAQCLIDYRLGRFDLAAASAIKMAQKTRDTLHEFSDYCAEFAAFIIESIEKESIDKTMPLVASLLDISARNHNASNNVLDQATYLAWGSLINTNNLMRSLEFGRDYIIANGEQQCKTINQ